MSPGALQDKFWRLKVAIQNKLPKKNGESMVISAEHAEFLEDKWVKVTCIQRKRLENP
jgi:hypothetical protein